MGVDVDEAGCDDPAFRGDLVRAAGGDPTHRSDPPAGDGDVGFERLGAGTVDDEPAPDDQIEFASHPLVYRGQAMGAGSDRCAGAAPGVSCAARSLHRAAATADRTA